MTDSSLQSPATAVLVADEADASRVVTCPMCHTPSPLSESAIAAGGDWRCMRCGQHWDGARLAAVAAYAAWVVDHDKRRARTEDKEGE